MNRKESRIENRINSSENIWRKNTYAIFLAAIVGGLADLGYFLFLDLGGYVNFVPGTVMTLFSASAIILSFYAYFKIKRTQTE